VCKVRLHIELRGKASMLRMHRFDNPPSALYHSWYVRITFHPVGAEPSESVLHSVLSSTNTPPPCVVHTPSKVWGLGSDPDPIPTRDSHHTGAEPALRGRAQHVAAPPHPVWYKHHQRSRACSKMGTALIRIDVTVGTLFPPLRPIGRDHKL